MAELRDTQASNRDIGIADAIIAFDTTSTLDANAAKKTDTLEMVIATIFENPPATLTTAQQDALRLLMAALSEAEVDARAVVRYTNAEKSKVAATNPILTFGIATGQTAAEFSYPNITGFNPTSGFPSEGQIFTFQTQDITVTPANADTHVTINLGGAVYTPSGIGDIGIPLEEFKPLTRYVAVGYGLLTCILIGPTDLLEDDVIDVTRTGLPALNADNYEKLFIDHDTPRVWVGHREVIAAVPATGTWMGFSARGGIYLGARSSAPSTVSVQRFYYNTRSHVWREGTRVGGVDYYINTPFQVLPGNDTDDIWLGEQPDDAAASVLVAPFNTASRYHFYNEATDTVRTLNNLTYVDPVSAFDHFVAEPISSPSGVSGITGVTAGTGLSGGGTSGVVTVNVDISASNFPTIPIDKGGTGADTDSGARSNLGLGTAALVDTGNDPGDVPVLAGLVGIVQSQDLAGNSGVAASGDVLTFDGTSSQSWTTPSAASSAPISGNGSVGSPLTIADSAITEPKLAIAADPTSNQVLTWDGSAMVWSSPASGAVTTDNSFNGTGIIGSPLTLNTAGSTFPTIPIEKGGTAATTVADARTSLGLGTAAQANTGTSSGEVPALDTSGHISDGVIPDGITRDTEVQTLFNTALTFATTGNTEVGINIDYNTSTRKLNATVTGALIHSDASLSGSGTTTDPLMIANNAVTEPRMAIGNTPTDLQVLSWDAGNTRFLWKDDATAAAGSGIDRVNSDSTLTGEGTALSALGIADNAITEARLSVTNSPTAGRVLGYNSSGDLEWVVGGGGGGGAVDSVSGGTGLTTNTTTGDVTVNIDVAQSDFPVIPLDKGGTGGTTQLTARAGIGLSTAVTSIGENAGQLTVAYADGTNFNVPLEEGGSFRGEGHEVFQGGDTFLTTANGTRFEFGDYAIVDDILYIYNHSAERTGVQPDNIATQTDFTEIPRALPNPTGTATIALTSIGFGDTIYSVSDPLTANLETLTNMNVGSISPSDIFYFRDINVDGNRKLSIGALREYLDDVIDVTGTGLPVLTADNYKKIYIDHDTPRVWVGHREERAATDAQGTFVAYTNSNYHGVHSGNGPAVPQQAGQYYYNRSFSAWYTTFLLNTTYYWSSGSFSTIFGSTARWLGEHPDATTAAGLIQNFDAANIYVYYRSDIAFRTVEVLTNNTYVAPVMGETHYTSEPLGAGLGMSGITGVLTAATGGLSGGAVSGDANLSLNFDGLNVFQTTEINSADSFVVRDTSSSTDPYSSINLGRLVGHIAGNTNTLSESGGRMSVADGGITVTQLADAGITEPKLFATNDPTMGQILSYAGGTDVNFTWIDATGGGGGSA